MSDFDTYAARYERHRQNVRRANELNKATLFDALAAAGIPKITVAFDGCGDSGQIEGITVHIGETPQALLAAVPPPLASQAVMMTPLPETPITLYQAQWDSDELGTEETTLQDAIETLCHGYLEQEHDGWEINDGSYGEFEFDVAARTIHLEFNGRFSDVYTETHTF
jgi:hypothetical protein